MRQTERYEILKQLKQEQFTREKLPLTCQLFLRKILDKIRGLISQEHLTRTKLKNHLNKLSKR